MKTPKGLKLSEAELAILQELGDVANIGSQYIPGAAHEGSDWDYLVLPHSVLARARLEQWLEANGFALSTPGEGSLAGEDFSSYKRGDVNVIIASCPEFWHGALTGQALCEALRLTQRSDRVIVWQYCLYGNLPGDE